MGDLNAGPEADEIRFLSGLSVQDGKSVHFADAPLWPSDHFGVYAEIAVEPRSL